MAPAPAPQAEPVAPAPAAEEAGKRDEKAAWFAYAAAAKVLSGLQDAYGKQFGRARGRKKLSDEEQVVKEEMQKALAEARDERTVGFEFASTQTHRI